MNKKLLFNAFRNTTAAAIYIFLVSQVMQNGSKLFGEKDTMLTPFIVLLLFSLSAAVVGGLVFGQSALLLLEGKKKAGIESAIYSVGWLGFYTMAAALLMILLK